MAALEARVELAADGTLAPNCCENTPHGSRRCSSFRRWSSPIRPAADAVRSEALPGLAVTVRRADGKKCERCWNYSTRVGESADYPTVCERCVAALDEIERGGSQSARRGLLMAEPAPRPLAVARARRAGRRPRHQNASSDLHRPIFASNWSRTSPRWCTA